MTDPNGFVPRSPSRRAVTRRSGASERRADGGSQNLPAVIPTPAETSRSPVPSAASPLKPAIFAAQLLGQDGQKRGLRGGPETLDKARASYLEAEWSGPADRRPPAGRITKTEI